MKLHWVFQSMGAVLMLVFVLGLTPPDTGEFNLRAKELRISNGMEVSMEYTIWLNLDTVADTNVGGEPVTYIQGMGTIVPGLEISLLGMKVGDRSYITVPPVEAYGSILEDALREVSKEGIPLDALEVGMVLQGESEDGEPYTVHIREIREETVILDLNHPLAGKTLYIDVHILDIRKPSSF